MTKSDLDGAYAIKTPEDSVKLYGEWAETYDEGFAQSSGYQLPEAVAEAFARSGGEGPVLDVGAGTGLVGVALRGLEVGPIDGTDISSAMLAEAAMKDCYENLFESDVTAELDLDDGSYKGVVSAGTFTHGHVGPDALDELLRIAKRGALFVISINTEHYTSRGFAAKLDSLASQIQGLTLHETGAYDGSRQDSHAKDAAMITVFRKA